MDNISKGINKEGTLSKLNDSRPFINLQLTTISPQFSLHSLGNEQGVPLCWRWTVVKRDFLWWNHTVLHCIVRYGTIRPRGSMMVAPISWRGIYLYPVPFNAAHINIHYRFEPALVTAVCANVASTDINIYLQYTRMKTVKVQCAACTQLQVLTHCEWVSECAREDLMLKNNAFNCILALPARPLD